VTSHPPPHAPALEAEPLGLDDLERRLARSQALARCLIAGLPTLGALAAVFFGLPLFAALMAGCFLLATALTCRQALATFAGKTLRLLVTARLVVVLVVGALLFCAWGSAGLPSSAPRCCGWWPTACWAGAPSPTCTRPCVAGAEPPHGLAQTWPDCQEDPCLAASPLGRRVARTALRNAAACR
jgi:hypothetical protein